MDALGIIFTVLAIIAVIVVILYFVGRKLMKKQNEANELMAQNRQTVSALVIDKKKAKLDAANFPQAAAEKIPWYLKNRKYPLAKVKIGPQMVTLICDPEVYKNLPIKKIVKIDVSGAYITGFTTAKKGEKKPEKPVKLTFRQKLQAKLNGHSKKVKEISSK